MNHLLLLLTSICKIHSKSNGITSIPPCRSVDFISVFKKSVYYWPFNFAFIILTGFEKCLNHNGNRGNKSEVTRSDSVKPFYKIMKEPLDIKWWLFRVIPSTLHTVCPLYLQVEQTKQMIFQWQFVFAHIPDRLTWSRIL